jgi:hypothetical protein
MPIDTYHVKGEAGHVGTPGAPIMEFHLLVVVGSGHASGHVEIRQALPPPNGEIFVNNVSGQVHELGPAPHSLIVTLAGTYTRPIGPPPLIGEILEHFSATLHVNHEWHGHGSFSYGGHNVTNVPVRKLP